MKTIEYENDHGYLITEDDQELLCPFTRDICLASKCAMSVFVENFKGITYYCGLIVNKYNIAWNEASYRTPCAPWTLGVTREKLCDETEEGDYHGSQEEGLR